MRPPLGGDPVENRRVHLVKSGREARSQARHHDRRTRDQRSERFDADTVSIHRIFHPRSCSQSANGGARAWFQQSAPFTNIYNATLAAEGRRCGKVGARALLTLELA
jgi:hypothetical protein